MKEIIKKFRLVLPIFLFGILFSIPIMKTKALRSDTFWFEWINPKIYVSKYKDGIERSERIQIYHRSADGAIVYCMQPGVDFSDTTAITGYDFNQSAMAGMSEATWERINLIAYYGYGYGNHTDSKWYAITQYEIWKANPLGWDTYWVDSFHGSIISQFEAESNELMTLVNNHYKKPSFDGKTINMPIKDKLTLTDTNGVLDKYKVSLSGNATYKVSGNTLTIYPTNEGKINISMQKDSTRLGRNALAYVGDGVQNLLFSGDLNSIKATININAISGSFELFKTGESVKWENEQYIYSDIELKGVKFGLYANEDIYNNADELLYKKDSLIGEYITDENGYLKIDNMYLGKYYVKEIETVLNHVLDENKYEFEITRNSETSISNETLELKNHLPKGDLEFTKTNTEGLVGLPNTLIEIYTIDNKWIYSGRTDLEGKIKMKGLPLGKYYIVEKEAPDGYYLNSNKIIFEVKEDGETVYPFMVDELIVVDVPKTDLNSFPLLEVISLVAGLMGLGIIVYVKRKK